MVLKSENKNKWEEFAREDTMFYIDTSAKDLDDFWKRGERNFERYILPVLEKHSVSKKVGVDFGCGIGRLTFPMAGYFEEMIGVDVSSSMIAQAREFANEKNVNNVTFILDEEFFKISKSIDFVYSVNVFQHIKDFEQIKSILRNILRLLDGYLYVQFDTRALNFSYRLKKNVPDFFLPKSQRKGIRRIRRSAKDLRRVFEKLGMKIIKEENQNSASHFFLLKKKSKK